MKQIVKEVVIYVLREVLTGKVDLSTVIEVLRAIWELILSLLG